MGFSVKWIRRGEVRKKEAGERKVGTGHYDFMHNVEVS